MRKRSLVIAAMMLTAASMAVTTGCSKKADTETTVAASEETEGTSGATEEVTAANTFTYTDSDKEAPAAGDTVTGVVTAVDGNTITLTTYDMDEMGGGDMEVPSGDTSDSGAPALPDGETPDGNEPPTLPEGETAGEGGAPELPDGETKSEDGAPELPDGETKSEDGAPALPDGETMGEGGAPALPDGETMGENDAPAKPEDGNASADATGDTADDSESEAEFIAVDTDDAFGQPGGTDPREMDGTAGQGGDMQMPEGDEATLVIGDESVLTKQGDSGESESASLSDIEEGTMLTITFGDDCSIASITIGGGMGNGGDMGQGGQGGQGGVGNMGGSGVDSYDAVTTYSEDTSTEGESYTSTGTDENAILVDSGATVNLSDATVERTSSDSTGGDNSSFYGVGAAVLATDGTLTITDSTITTDAAGAAGVFAYGDGVVEVRDTTISTKQNTSGGIHVAGGGELHAYNLTVETDGESAAAIRSDRGGGTMTVEGGTYTSNGLGSPALYCTADITVSDATLVANGSEAICMEGLNSIHLYDTDVTGNMSDLSQNDTTWNVIIYQSMSGDAEEGNSTFQMVGGSLTAKNGGMFYTTNTESNILLSDVDITYAEDSEFFLQATGNANERGWGSTGSNGADCTFTAIDQDMIGDVIWDSISDLNFYMESGSTLTGAVVDDETYAGNGGDGYCSIYMEAGTEWVVTGDSTVTNLYAEGTITDENGKAVTIQDADGNVLVKGSSSYTVTVTGEYSTSVDLSGAAEIDAQ